MAVTPARLAEVQIAFGKRRQTNPTTANVLADIWTLHKVNAGIANVQFVRETDADDMGKGHDFVTETFASHVNVSGTLEKYNSADFLAWAVAMGLGTVTPSGAAGSGPAIRPDVPRLRRERFPGEHRHRAGPGVVEGFGQLGRVRRHRRSLGNHTPRQNRGTGASGV
jgi:hypothetical protein